MGASSQSKKRTVVGVSMRPDELAELDRQRSRLGRDSSGEPKHSRSTALKLIWSHFGDDAVDAAGQHQDLAAQQQDVAAAAAKAAQPLAEALQDAGAAWRERAHQRQAIGVNVNQIARLANTLLAKLRDGEAVDEDLVDSLVLALQGIERRLDEQMATESQDDRVLAEARAALAGMQWGPAA